MGKTLSVAPAKKPTRRSAIKPQKKRWRRARIILGVVGFALLLRLVVLQGYRVPSRAMEDTLLLGDCLLVEKLSYGAALPFDLWRLPGLGRPTPGDLVVFRLPEEPDRVYVKRCLAIAGQVVEIVDKVAYVDGVRLTDPSFSKYIDARIFSAERSSRDNFGPVEVPVGSVFLLGDNRDNSRDSRHWGFVSEEALVGRSLGVYWSVEPYRGVGSWMEALGQLPQRIRWERVGQWLR